MSQSTVGVLFAVAAYLVWAALPIYWKILSHYSATEITSHRIFWSGVVLTLFLLLRGRLSSVREILTQTQSRTVILVTAGLITGNWYLYVWAVNHEHLIEASFGYYINPLLSVVLGVVFLKEKLSTIQKTCVVLAGAAVTFYALAKGLFPWIALALASSFGIYGLLRKKYPMNSLAAVATENIVVTPITLGLLFWIHKGPKVFDTFSTDSLLFLGAGAVSALPLIFFGEATKRVRLATVGFLQYIGPSGNLILAVTLFGETFTTVHLVTFSIIWVALILFSWDSYRNHQLLKGSRV